MTKPENGYSDALDALITISPAVKGVAYSVRLWGQETSWTISLACHEGQAARRLVRYLGAHEAPDLAFQSDTATFRVWRTSVGRVPIDVTCDSTIVRRVSPTR